MTSRRQLREWTGYATTSMRLDLALLRSPTLTWRDRIGIPAAKYRSVPAILGRHRATIRVGELTLELASISDLGTLHSAIADVQQVLVPAGILNARAAGRRLKVIDVGANIGQFAAAVLLAAPDAHLTCFEPDPDVFRRLSANLAGTDADLRCQALLSQVGQGPLYRNNLSVMSTMLPDQSSPRTESQDGETVMVSITTLDAAVPGHEPIDLLKIDVEGAEYETLAGGTDLLGRTRYLLVEMSLTRGSTPTNMRMLELIVGTCPNARILCFGRALGDPSAPACQDVLISLRAG